MIPSSTPVNHRRESCFRREFKLLALILTTIILAVAGMGCGNPAIDLTGYGDDGITLIGLEGEGGDGNPVELTITELQNLDCVTIKTESTSDKIGRVSATGPLLDTVLAAYGTSPAEYNKIIITAVDGYEVVLNQPFINENKIILAFGIDGKPLGEDEAPLRLIIPESDSAYWIRMIQSIEFIK